LADRQVLPADLVGAGPPGDAVDLEPDEPLRVAIVAEVGRRHAVDPGAVAVALHDDAIAVPPVGLERLLGLGRLRPLAVDPLAVAGLVVELAGGAVGRDLALRAVEP